MHATLSRPAQFRTRPLQGIIRMRTTLPRCLLLSLVSFWAGGSAAPADDAKENKPAATPADALKVTKDFKAELLYSVPKGEQGSWVNLCADPKGRLIVSDQYGPLYRVTPPATGGKAEDTKVEKLDLPLGGAHGLLWAFDALYVMVNEDVQVGGQKPKRGLWRVKSKDGGDTFEKPEFLNDVDGGSEHGCHAIVPGPDGK